MPNQSRMRKFPSFGYNPDEIKQEYFARCTVCGWAGIDLNMYQSGIEVAPIFFEIDEETGLTVTTVAAFAACPFCGSPNFDGGSAPDLRW